MPMLTYTQHFDRPEIRERLEAEVVAFLTKTPGKPKSVVAIARAIQVHSWWAHEAAFEVVRRGVIEDAGIKDGMSNQYLRQMFQIQS